MASVRPLRIAVALAAAALLGPLPPSRARAEPPSASDVEAARAHYRRGVQLYGERNYEEALVELQRAKDLAPTFRLFYDIALVQRELGDAAGALRSFASYLDAGAEAPPARRAEVERAIAELTAKVATVTVTSNVDGAEITDGDRVVGTTPLAVPLRLNPGPHRIGMSKAGYRPVTKPIDVGAGDRAEIPFSLEESAPPAPVSPVAAPPVSPAPGPGPAPVASAPEPMSPPASLSPSYRLPAATPGRRPPPTWIGWTATGALAAGAVATGIAALVQSNTLRSEIDDRATAGPTIHSAHAATATLALVSDVLTGAAIAAAGVTLYVKLASKPRSAAAPPARTEVRAGLGGVWLSATF
jgi:hypothetical protein